MSEEQIPAVFRRQRVAPRRTISDAIGGQTAATALGALEQGMEVFGFTMGQFSVIHLLAAILAQTGPADVTISTWTAASREIDVAYNLLRDGRVRSLRFLVDFSFPRRQPRYCEQLRERFGDACLRVTKSHAKFLLIRNETWNLCVRTSMNLNENTRFETFEVSDDLAMAEFLESVVAMVFRTQGESEGFTRRPSENTAEFDLFGRDPDRNFGDEASRFGATLDDANSPGFSVV